MNSYSPRSPGDESHRLSDAGYGVDHTSASAPSPPAFAPSPLKQAAKRLSTVMGKARDGHMRSMQRHASRELVSVDMEDDDDDMGGSGYAMGGGGGPGGGGGVVSRAKSRSILVENRTDLELVVRVRAFGIGFPGIKPNECLVGGYSAHGVHEDNSRKAESDSQTALLKSQLESGAISQEEYDAMVKAYKKAQSLDREHDKWQAVKKVRSQDVEHPVGEVKCMPAVNNTVAIHFSPALKGKSPQYREAPICTTKAVSGDRVIVYYNCDGYVVANPEDVALLEIEQRARDIAQGKAQSKVHCSACGSIVTCPPHACLGTVSFRCPKCNTLLELNVAGQ